MRIGTWNIEWFDALFDARGRMLEDDAPSARYGVTRAEQLRAIRAVLAALDADLLLVVEAPDGRGPGGTVDRLQAAAAAAGIRARRALSGFPNDSQQEIALLYDPDRMAVRHDPQEGAGGAAPRFDGSYRIDLDIDATLDTVRFAKPPLEAAVDPVDRAAFRLIGVHVKSKAPHGADDPAHAARIAIQNRRRQLAECIWLRERVAGHLAAGEALVVLGDFNDGPGLDEFEALFGRSGLEIVLGQEAPPGLRLHDPHALPRIAHATAAAPASARFWRDSEGQYFSAMLDFVLLSPGLVTGARWRIWHPFDDPAIYRNAPLRDSLLAASDHYPVTVDLPATG
ncbi:endonuclease/exonuclease/phosphatase family protein [Frigidibacter oleivorans]|uniref:endonuclease/exonuclease/phosphatase family protein n=1 Tax=Frigidibacter oleivorans TaxID=2487129 RepID=UPI000F8CDFF0|nr:endonuclease/exonuclease/phosphatase family protein [Frigidibacter oleivorans]